MRLTISRTLLLIYLGIAILSVISVGIATSWVKERSVASLALSESRRNAELVFQNLYSVMRKGWSKAEIAELVQRMNSTVPDIHVGVFRSPAVARQYGEIEQDRLIRQSDAAIMQVMASGKELLQVEGPNLRYVYPVLVTEECQGCHADTPIGAVNGVIDISFPTDSLKVPLNFTLNTLIYVFAVLVTLMLVVVLLKVRYLIAMPISGLAQHIEEILVSGDLSRRVVERASRWLIEVNSLTLNFNRLMEELQGSRDELVRQSTTDPLTGLSNRLRFGAELPRELDRARRHQLTAAVIMIDLDGFKPINDTYGHGAGDLVLVAVAEAMRRHSRTTDLPARLGGDEFAVLVPEATPDGVKLYAERLRDAIAAATVTLPDGEEIGVGASIGVALFPEDGDNVKILLEQADQGMYEDKKLRKAGR